MLLNQVVIDGSVQSVASTRYTAAGEPVIKFQLSHQSQPNPKVYRGVDCEITVQCVGQSTCCIASTFEVNDNVRVKGFLTKNTAKDAFSWIIIEAIAVEKLNNIMCDQEVTAEI